MVRHAPPPYYFDEFFASGREESISPFLTPTSRKWSKNLALKSALFSALLLSFSFATSFFHPQASHLLLACVYFLVGTPALIGSVEDLRNLEINIDVLMTLAALLSVVIGSALEGALLLVLFELSAALEGMVAQKTKSALHTLHQLSPKIACMIAEDGTLYERSVKEIAIGEHLLIKSGEIVPLDGIVLEGSSFVNLSHLTGESAPLPKKKGDEVPAGARNLEGSLTLEVTRTSSDSTLSRIIHLITQAQSAKPQVQRFLDRFGKVYATTIILLSFFFALSLPFIFQIPYLGPEGAIYRALAFLIAASPCALILATPTAYLSAISSCARKGILLKGGVVLDALSNCRSIAFDKTGTLTTGKLSCTSVTHISEKKQCDLETAISIAAALEQNAVHPIAEAITSYAKEKGIKPIEIHEFKATPGFGLEGKVDHFRVAIGHAGFIGIKGEIKEGQLATFLLVDETLFAFHFTDEIRPSAKTVLAELKDKMQLLMLTGDHKQNALHVAKQIGLENVFHDLRPEDKLAQVAELSQNGLIMVGDGINDAPALTRATVGISMGKIGSATAVDASDVVFLQDDLTLLPWLLHKADQTMSVVRLNLILALAVIAFATIPALLGLLPLWIAVILHEGGTVLVGLNSLRLLRR